MTSEHIISMGNRLMRGTPRGKTHFLDSVSFVRNQLTAPLSSDIHIYCCLEIQFIDCVA